MYGSRGLRTAPVCQPRVTAEARDAGDETEVHSDSKNKEAADGGNVGKMEAGDWDDLLSLYDYFEVNWDGDESDSEGMSDENSHAFVDEDDSDDYC
jgi:hypothetical protein